MKVKRKKDQAYEDLLWVLTRQGRHMPRLKMPHESWALPFLRQRLTETAKRLMETVKRRFQG